MTVSKTIDYLQAGAELNLQDPLRNGNMLCFPGEGDLIVAGDLHNHKRNFERIRTVSALDQFPKRHVILQELIHGGALGAKGEDRSLDMLLEAVEWAREYPGRIHFLMANHDLAQVQSQSIMKDGYDLTDRFNRYLTIKGGGSVVALKSAFGAFVYSMPLAAITVTGVFLSHSLPGPRDMATFDNTILRRQLTDADFLRTGSVYQLIWGRSQTPEVLATLSKSWWSDLFVCGHQAQDTGYGTIGDRMLILDSSHNHGVFLPIDLSRQFTLADLTTAIRPLAAIA